MGALYSKISRLQLNDKNEESNKTKKEIKLPEEERTPCKNIKYLVDPRSATAGIKRTPLVVLVDEMGTLDRNDTPVRPPYLETDLDKSECTIRTSTPVISDSPIRDILRSSPVLPLSGSLDSCNDEMSTSLQDELFSINSDEEDGNEVLNNERMLFESEDQGSFDDEEIERNIHENSIEKLQNRKEIVFMLEDTYDPTDTEIEEILTCEVIKTSAETTLERQYTEVEDCLFSAINSPMTETDTEKSKNVWINNKFGEQFKNKHGRIPLSVVSSNPCSPRKNPNVIKLSPKIDTNKEGKSWRGITEERANRGLLDVENTPPTLPPPDIIQSAPGKLLLANRGGRIGKTTWARDNSLII